LAKKEEIKKLNCGKVLADFREVPSIGSMGIGFLVAIYISVTNSGNRFVLVGAVPRVQQVLDKVKRTFVVATLSAWNLIRCSLSSELSARESMKQSV